MSADNTAPIQFAGFFLEWDRIEDDKAELAEQSKDLFKAMKDQGYNPPAARVAFREQRIKRNASFDDIAKAEANEADVDLYRSALARGLEARAHPAPAREKPLDNFGSYAEVKGVERPAQKIEEGLREALAVAKGEAEPARWHGAEPTQEQPETASQSEAPKSRPEAAANSAAHIDTPATAKDFEPGLAGPACDHDDDAANTKPALIPHSPAVLPGKADKISEAVVPPASSLVAIPDSDVPAFLRKDVPVDVTSPEFIKLLRPFCQNLDDCHGHGRECSKCKAARAA